MGKRTYPDDDIYKYVSMRRTQNGVEQQAQLVPLSRFRRITSSQVSPGYPQTLVENPFWTQTIVDQWSPALIRVSDMKSPLTTSIRNASVDTSGPPTRLRGELHDQLVRRFYNKVNLITADLALIVAERKKTAESIATAVEGIISFARAVKQRRCPELFMNTDQLRQRKKFSSAWLNYQYGIAPFVSDLYNIGKNADTRPPVIIKVRSRRDWKRDTFDSKSRKLTSTEGSIMETMRYGIIMDNAGIGLMQDYGLVNPLTFAWELLPFSFVVDWALPVGTYLGNLTSTVGYQTMAGSTTIGSRYTSRGQDPDSPATAEQSFRAMSRSKTAFPSVPLPAFQNPFSPTRALNALAILHQIVGGRGPVVKLRS